MKKEKKKSNSAVPAVIILAVLIIAIIGAYVLYNSSRSGSTTNSARNNASNSPRPTMNYESAPPGATPPHMIGSPTATVTLEEFADFQCGSCAAAHPVLKEITSTYGGNRNFRFVFRHYPLPGHDKAYDAALAAEAAALQGTPKFWQMQDQIFTNQALWTDNPNYRELFAEYAQKIGLDVEKFKADLSGMQAKTRVDQDLNRGRALGVNSTPTVMINGKVIPYAQVTTTALRQIIDAELQAASAPAANTATGNTANK